MNPLNYVWYQHRQRLAARMFEADGEDGLARLWNASRSRPVLCGDGHDGVVGALLEPKSARPLAGS